MEEELAKDEYVCLFFDLEGYGAPSEWISDLFVKVVSGKEAKLKNKASMLFTNLCKGMGTSESATEAVLRGLFDASNWRERGNAIFEALVNSLEEKKRLVVFLDELAVMIEHFKDQNNDQKKEADIFLSWLHGIQQKHSGKLSFVAASSIGLSPLLNKLGLSSRMNAFSVFPLDAWDKETAVRCIRALADGEGTQISDDVALCMVEFIGWCSPLYVQLFFGVLKDSFQDKVCTCDDAAKIYREKIVRGPEGSYQLTHMEERLRNFFNEREYGLAMRTLSCLSKTDAPVMEGELVDRVKPEVRNETSFQYIMQNLEHDGYIEKNENGWFFRPGLLKDWWRHRYGDMYNETPS